MSFVNDVGGMHGFGEVPVDAPRGPVKPWSPRVWAINQALIARGLYTFDDYRHAIERMHPAAYFAASSDDRRLFAVETLVRERVTSVEGAAAGPARSGVQPRPARFEPGSRVAVRTDSPPVHTRTPRYVRGRRGVIHALRGRSVRPEDRAAGGEDAIPQQIYSVRFEASELWGRQGSPRCPVLLDLWEDALEPTG